MEAIGILVSGIRLLASRSSLRRPSAARPRNFSSRSEQTTWTAQGFRPKHPSKPRFLGILGPMKGIATWTPKRLLISAFVPRFCGSFRQKKKVFWGPGGWCFFFSKSSPQTTCWCGNDTEQKPAPSIWLRPKEKTQIFPAVIDSLSNQHGKIKKTHY